MIVIFSRGEWIMKRKRSLVLDENDERAVELFADLGMPKNLAKTLIYISQCDECKSSEVEQGANLRQPEVSIAMQELRKKGWAKKRDLKKKGKGRPVHVYTLTKPLPEILHTFEQEKMDQVENIKMNLESLQSLIKEYKE
jgi:predicted transcriptional regulator